MTYFKTTLMTAALLALPSFAMAQVSTDALTDKVKDKAVETVIDNATPDDALTAGKVLLKGGSKEDAAVAIVKNRVEDKVDGLTDGAVSMEDMSKDGMIEAGKDMAKDKAMEKVEGHSSATKYENIVQGEMGDKDYAAPAIIHKSGVIPAPVPAPVVAPTLAPTLAPAPAALPVNCPSGTTAQADGTCMITGNWTG